MVDQQGKLAIMPTANQDSPISKGMIPVLGLDVWEHAYYVKYHNKRPDYINAWWHVINWDEIEENYRGQLDEKNENYFLFSIVIASEFTMPCDG